MRYVSRHWADDAKRLSCCVHGDAGTLTVDCHVGGWASRQDLRSGNKQKALTAAGEEADDDQAGLPRLNAINALMQVGLPTATSTPQHFR